MALTTHLHLAPRSRMNGVIPLLPYGPSWRAQKKKPLAVFLIVFFPALRANESNTVKVCKKTRRSVRPSNYGWSNVRNSHRLLPASHADGQSHCDMRVATNREQNETEVCLSKSPCAERTTNLIPCQQDHNVVYRVTTTQ